MDLSFIEKLGLKSGNPGTSTGITDHTSDKFIASYSPVNGEKIGEVSVTTKDQYEQVVEAARKAFVDWRMMPAPQRGEIVRQYGNVLRENKDALGRLVSYEMGKSLQEGWGEVQEMIDITYAILQWGFRDSCTDSPFTPSDRDTACTNSGIRWVW